MSSMNSGVKMQREQLKLIMDMMSKHGIIRITYDVTCKSPELEIWTVSSFDSETRLKQIEPLTKADKEYFVHEYDKCFGTAPRSDEK